MDCKRCGSELTVHVPTILLRVGFCVPCTVLILVEWTQNLEKPLDVEPGPRARVYVAEND